MAQTFTKWSNNHLRRRFGSAVEPIKEIQDDLDDGIYVLKLIHALYDTKIPKYNPNPKMRPHKLDNISQALKMIETAGIKTHFLKPGRTAKALPLFQPKALPLFQPKAPHFPHTVCLCRFHTASIPYCLPPPHLSFVEV